MFRVLAVLLLLVTTADLRKAERNLNNLTGSRFEDAAAKLTEQTNRLDMIWELDHEGGIFLAMARGSDGEHVLQVGGTRTEAVDRLAELLSTLPK